jgi:protein-disulfide isomerase
MQERARYLTLFIIGVAGLIVAALAGLAEHVDWLGAMCAGLSDGCKDTARFTVFRLPVWGWGVAFYALLAVVVFRARQMLVWLVGTAFGIEAALVSIMISMKVLCVFCLGNLLVVILLVAFSFEKERFWQMLAISLSLFLLSSFLISHENELMAFSTTKQEPPGIVAKVAGEVLTSEELDRPLASSIFDLEMDIYRLKKQRLDQMISEKLLQMEAAGRGITVQQLLNESVLSEQPQVNDDEVDKYYEDNRARLAAFKGSEQELRERIRTYLLQQQNYKKVTEYSASLGLKYGVTVYLKAPEPPAAQVDTEGSPSLGPPDAPVTVVEFSDYRCPACRQAHETVRKVRQLYAGRLRWIFKDYPLQRHKDAELAAEAGKCAAEQNKFWEYQDLLYGSEEELTFERLEGFASRLGMAEEQFKLCLEGRKYKDGIEKELEEARKIGVDRTPTFVVNGRLMVGGLSLERFKEVIDSELGKETKKQP